MDASVSLLLALAVSQGHAEQARSELDLGRYRAAWQEMLAESDPVSRFRVRAAILYRAGDPRGVLEAAEEGLGHAPGDLELLHRATSAAIWLQDAPRAEELAGRLQQALAVADLAPEHRAAWEADSASFLARAAELVRHEQARERALRRARAVSAILLIGSFLYLVSGRFYPAITGGPGDRSRRSAQAAWGAARRTAR